MTPFPLARLASIVLPILCLLLSSFPLRAHNSSKGLSAVNIQLFPDRMEAQLALSFFDTGIMLNLDKDKNGEITKEEVQATVKELEQMAAKDLQFYFDGKVTAPKKTTGSIQESNFEVQMVFDKANVKSFSMVANILKKLTPDHQQYVTVKDAAGAAIPGAEATLSPADVMFQYGGGAGQTVAVAGSSTFVTFLKHGFRHILFGYDHLLFLLALLIVCETFWSLAKIITCFTLAHSISLALSTLGIVTLKASIVEPIVALTIVYVGIENLFKLKTLQWRWVVTFAFGLIHGFAFANELRDKGLTKGQVFVPLLSFNLGVEAGQLLIAALVLPILWQVRKVPQIQRGFVPVTSAVVIILGGIWFVQRVWY